ncbi:biopolymer transport protein TolQ [Halopseudomonas xinjiangensis]|uniref:Biopolymer transport protein TolQ n=1 Tax=Halopseudomonas xinjiangensis TaxID=487184 RepID=A0A1H1RA02_9GAMM|nr:MotA/TolQ/ExbB proton channel family protein [Halopseudomonas xinjiangensis]SDS31709.1 biopolymer transport protein TolQ [Halopseudomonas xinjiangensis]
MYMHAVRSVSARWQARLRLVALLTLLGCGGMSAGLVLAQAEPTERGRAQAQPQVEVEPALGAAETGSFGVREMFEQADLVVKAVMIVLVVCSLLTWAVLLEKIVVFGRARRGNLQFLAAFRRGDTAAMQDQAERSAMGRMWQVAQAELQQFGRRDNPPADQINRLLQRMSLTSSIVQERDLARLGSMMGVLATIGATAPFIGLFGTVWGILNSFASIATLKSASLAVVAPGIAEALLATALGLFAAIPAVMIFNKFARDINGFVGSLDNFSAEMIASASRQMDGVR